MKQIIKYAFSALFCLISITVYADRVDISEVWNGSVTYSIDGSKVTLTVIPDDDFYIDIDDILVEKTVDGGVIAQSRRRGPNIAAPIKVTAVDVDDRGKGTYTFQLVEGYGAFVMATFHYCQYLYPSVSIEGWTYGETPNKPVVTGNESNGEVTVTYAIEGSGDYSPNVPTDVGCYRVKVTIAAKGHYMSASETASFCISPAPLTITANNYTIKQGDPLPDFEATYAGFVNDETSDVLTTHPSFSTLATSSSEPGTYEIVAYDAEAQNYEITYVNGTLTITPADGVLMGDVNNDGNVDVSDIVAVVDYILQKPIVNFNIAAADINGDNRIDVSDVVGIVDIILGR